MFKRTALAFLVALTVALLSSAIAFAADYFISEYGSAFAGSGLTNLTCSTGWTCQDGNAKRAYLKQTGGYDATGKWNATAAPSGVRRMDWYAFIPNNGNSANFAAVKYKIANTSAETEVYVTTVNQTNWKGQYVSLGFLNNGSWQSYMWMANQCVPGFLCSNTLPVYYDKGKFAF